MLYAQISGVDQAIEATRQEGGWIAVVLVVIIFGLCGLTGFIVKWILARSATTEDRVTKEATEREGRYSKQVDDLQLMIRGELLSLIRLNTDAMGKMIIVADRIVAVAEQLINTQNRFTTVLESRPCVAEEYRRNLKDIKELTEEAKKWTKEHSRSSSPPAS